MATDQRHASTFIEQLLRQSGVPALERRLAPRHDDLPPKVPGGARLTPEALERRWQLLPHAPEARSALLDPETAACCECYAHNIENFIGTVKVPVGLAGPLRVNGLFAHGDYYLPLATTEAALVASYSRGAQLLSEAGGCTATLLAEGVSRAPGFAFPSVSQAGQFVLWAVEQMPAFRERAESTTAHGRLVDLRITVEGNHVYLNFEFTTGDAAGQNMVTLATAAIYAYILENTPVAPEYSFLEANLSGDKKASAQSFQGVRGKKVAAEAVIPGDLLVRSLRTTAARMADYWRMSALGGILSGTIGVQGHYANGLTALYLACGQDVACVAESAVGVTRFEAREDGALYASVTLPNIIVGTVGGGTKLPTARACLEILGLAGAGHARAFAEVCAGMALAGELSIIGALCSGEFARAHQKLARGKIARRKATEGESGAETSG